MKATSIYQSSYTTLVSKHPPVSCAIKALSNRSNWSILTQKTETREISGILFCTGVMIDADWIHHKEEFATLQLLGEVGLTFILLWREKTGITVTCIRLQFNMCEYGGFLFINIWRTSFLFVGPLFWISYDVWPRFQSQSGSLSFMLPTLCTLDSSDTPLVSPLDG